MVFDKYTVIREALVMCAALVTRFGVHNAERSVGEYDTPECGWIRVCALCVGCL